MKLKKKELIVCIGFFALSVLILILIPFQIEDRNFTAAAGGGIRLTTRSFPYFTAWLILIMSGLYLAIFFLKYIAAKKASGGEPVLEKGEKTQFFPIFMTLGCIYLYVFLFRRLGFIIDTMIFCFIMGLYLKSSKTHLLISSTIVPVVAYFIFKLMYVNLPSGILPF